MPDRPAQSTARVARAIASLLNPVLYPDTGRHLVISQEEVGLLAGVSRAVANQSLKTLAAAGVLRLEYSGLTVVDAGRLRRARAITAKPSHSTVTLLAKFRGLSTSVPRAQAV